MLNIIGFIDRFNKLIKYIVATSLGVMSVVIVVQVLARYIFHNTFTWSEELARYLMILMIFFGAALAIRTQSLIGLEIIAERLPHNMRRGLKLVVYIVSIIFFIVLFFLGLQVVDAVKNQLSPALQISMAIPYSIIPIGSVVLIINTVAVLLEIIKDTETIIKEEEL